MDRPTVILKQVSLLRRYNSWILHQFTPYLRGNILEAGSGIGTFSAYLALSGTDLTCVDNNPKLVEQLRNQFMSNHNVRILRHDLHKYRSDFLNRFDTIVIINVLEHLSQDRIALNHLHSWLKPRGHLLLLVPAHDFAFSYLDQLIGHQRRYSKSELISTLNQSGFTIQQIYHFNSLGLLGWLVFQYWLRLVDFPPAVLSLMDNLVPPLAWLENIFHPPFGLSLIAICSR